MPQTRPWSEIRAKIDADPVRRARVDVGVQALRDGQALVQLRAALGLPEYDRDDEADASEATPHRGEREEDLYVATLRSFIEAMGGHLEINAVFPDGRAVLMPDRTWDVSEVAGERPGADQRPAADVPSRPEPLPIGAATPSRRRG